MLDQIVVGILLLSPPVDWYQKCHQLMMVHLLEEDPSGRDMMLVVKELPAIVQVVSGIITGSIITGFTGSTGTGSIELSSTGTNMLFNHLAHIWRDRQCIHSIAVELDDLTLISEFEQNHGMDTVCLSIDSDCWPPEDIVEQAKLGMSALVNAAGNILLQLNNLRKQYETRRVLHIGLLLEELWSKVVPLYTLTNHCILQPGNSVIFSRK